MSVLAVPDPRIAADEDLQLAVLAAVGRHVAAPVDVLLQTALDTMCEALGYPAAHAYLYDEDRGELVSTPLWHVSNPARFRPLVRCTATTRIVEGVGLVGRALATAEPVWMPVIQDHPGFQRSRVALTAGLRAAFAVPVATGGRVAAVLEYFAPRHLEDDPDLAVLAGRLSSLLATALGRRVLVPS